jgi:hypothetical protein
MNCTLIERPPFPEASTYKVRPRLLREGIDAQSSSRLGHPITSDSPYEDGIADFDQPPWPENEDETWTEAKNQRRCDLIDHKYAGGLTPAETRELAQLQAQMLRHSQRVAPLPIEAAERLYKKLLAGVNTSPLPKNL